MRGALRVFSAVLAFAVFLPVDNSEAQLFRRWVQQRQSCPNGNCPTATVTRAAVVQSAGHWTYPGTIDGHLRSTHGVSTAGMTREQMLDLHDALHEGRAASTRPTVQLPAVQPVVQSTSAPAPMKVRPVSTQSLFGLEAYVEPVQSAVIPEHILAQVDEPKDEPMKVADSFRQTLAKAIVEARKNGKISFRDAVKLRVAMRSPAFVQRAQELAVTQVAFSGEESDAIPLDEEGIVQVEGINWEGLAKFLEAVVPLLISLLKAFGL